VSDGINQRSTGSRTEAVCSEENVSVDIEKITQAHTMAGHHARIQFHARGGRMRA
jgi:hypothetical protein